MSSISRRGFIKGATLSPLTFTAMAQQNSSLGPNNQFDFVIAGAGHNSLLSAAYLAKAGFSVVVLEGRAMIGGGAKTAEVLLPGFKQDLCSTVHSGFAANPAYRNNEINLRYAGLAAKPAYRNNEINLRDFGYELMDPEIA